MIIHLNLAIALEGDIGKAALASSPLRRDIHLLQIDLLGVMITGEDIVQTQCPAIEQVIKLLCHHRVGSEREK